MRRFALPLVALASLSAGMMLGRATAPRSNAAATRIPAPAARESEAKEESDPVAAQPAPDAALAFAVAEAARLQARLAELEASASASLKSRIEDLRGRIPELAARKHVVGLLNLASELAQLGKDAWPASMEALRACFDDTLAQERGMAGISFLGLTGFQADFMLWALTQEKVPRDLNGAFGPALMFNKQLDSKRILQALQDATSPEIVPMLIGALATRNDGTATAEDLQVALRRHSSPQTVDALLRLMSQAPDGRAALEALTRDPEPAIAEAARIQTLRLDPPCTGLLISSLHASAVTTLLLRGDIIAGWDGAELPDSASWHRKSKDLREGNGWATLTVLRRGATIPVRVTSSDLAALAVTDFLMHGEGVRESSSVAPPDGSK